MLLNIILALCLVFVAFLFLVMPGESTMEGRSPFWGVSFAHRGLHSRDKSVPENSMAAFTAALDAGYGIELDIHLSADGQVVVFHDDDLLRACGVQQPVSKLSYQELQSCLLFGTDKKIPLLEDVLSLVNQEVPLLIELKTRKNYKELCENAWDVLKTYDGDFCVQSFDPRIVRWFKKNVPGILRGQLSARPRELGGIKGLAIGLLLTNFLARPQFISYMDGALPPTARLARRLAMRFVWTMAPTGGEAADKAALSRAQEENDAVIFEFYRPEPRFKDEPEDGGFTGSP